MTSAPRRKSPSAPSWGLQEAFDRAQEIYDKEGRHAVDREVAAKDMGYKSIRSGAALAALGTLKAYSLIESPSPGMVAVTQAVEEYKLSPKEADRRRVAIECLKSPKIFAELLDKFKDKLPSDEALTFDLVRMGFKEKSARDTVRVFRESVDFARYFEGTEMPYGDDSDVGDVESNSEVGGRAERPPQRVETVYGEEAGFDRIPIRLAGGRRAWLEVPQPFYSQDKEVIKKQVQIIITDDEGGTFADEGGEPPS